MYNIELFQPNSMFSPIEGASRLPWLLVLLHVCAAFGVEHSESSTELLHDNTTYDPPDNLSVPATAKQIRWADAVYSFVSSLNCEDVYFTTEKECLNLISIPKQDMNIYIADPSPYGSFVTVLPDGGLSRTGVHDSVVVLDPYPRANFGHLVLVFYVEIGVNHNWCEERGGTYLDGGECLILAIKQRCKNALQRKKHRRNFVRRCEINFIPLVYIEHDEVEKSQSLTCRSNIPGFAPCPALRSVNETSELICNPIKKNTKRCLTRRAVVHTSCRMFEICDQAVIVSGGWNRWSSKPYHQDNVYQMYHMLRRHGFRRNNVQVFYANGAHGIPIQDDNGTDLEAPHQIHPAAFKHAMRYHLQNMCASPHCVDSLLLYLNSPGRTDGSSLLWDVNGDGQASSDEVYKLEELLEDLANCEARQVHVIADQSYSGEIARAFRHSENHKNVMVFTSSKDHEYSYGVEYSQLWAQKNHTNVCMKELHRSFKRSDHNSTPEFWSGDTAANVNIFGAPCDVVPPFTHKELRQNYLGCQNLPTALWVRKMLNPRPSLVRPTHLTRDDLNSGSSQVEDDSDLFFEGHSQRDLRTNRRHPEDSEETRNIHKRGDETQAMKQNLIHFKNIHEDDLMSHIIIEDIE